MEKKCKQITKEGKQCSWKALMKGYCIVHFNLKHNGKNKRRPYKAKEKPTWRTIS